VSRRRTASVAALATGAVGSALAGARLAERRAVGRARSRPDPFVNEGLGSLHTEGLDVLASDGVTLHVEVTGDLDAPVTIVFSHGFTLSMDAWHFQRRDLGDLGRLVFYDHRSHGRSGRSDPDHANLEQLARDLYDVLAAVAPSGPIVVVGQSMGGMTILALAEQHPEIFGDRVIGVGLLSTSSGEVARTIVGVPDAVSRALGPAVPHLVRLVGRQASLLERNRKLGTDFAFIATRYLSFAPDVPPSLVAFMERMMSGTSIEVMADFFPTLLAHDQLRALAAMQDIPVLISSGDHDTLIPLAHSELMAERLPHAELQIVPGAGHMAVLDRYAVVNAALRRLVAAAVELAPRAVAG
jgi:pimeloyl-ACP methyl ester carboxylesterase